MRNIILSTSFLEHMQSKMIKFRGLLFIAMTTIGVYSCDETNSANIKYNKQTVSPEPLTESHFPLLEPGVFNLTEKDFGGVIELTGTPIQSNVIFNPLEMEMIIKGDVLIMKTKVNTGMIKFLRLPGFELINEVGTWGRGPGELQSPRLIATSEHGLLCYLYDTRQDRVFQIDTGFTITETGFPLSKLATDPIGNKQFVEAGSRDFYYVSNSVSGKGLYHYDPNQPDSLTQVFDIEKDFKKNLTWISLIGFFGGNGIKNRLVYAYKYFHQISFFDPTELNSRVLRFDISGDRKTASENPLELMAPDNISYYCGMSSQPEGVYCSFSGLSPMEAKKEMDNQNDYMFIEQFNWNGHPVKKYKLDHWGYFCVDEERNCIYVAALNASEALYRYQI